MLSGITLLLQTRPFLDRRLPSAFFDEVVGKHSQTVRERLPCLTLRTNDKRTILALHLNFFTPH
jgi:hypothetical protein